MTLIERLNSRAWEHRQHRELREEAARRITALEVALRAIFRAADNACDEQEWADMVSAEMTDERRALVTED